MGNGAERGEHERLRKALTEWFHGNGFTNVLSPAKPVGSIVADVQGDYLAKRVYGEALPCEEFQAPGIRERLVQYTDALPSEYRLILGVPRSCQAEVQVALVRWGLSNRIQVARM